MAQLTYMHRVQEWLEGFGKDAVRAQEREGTDSGSQERELEGLVDMALGLHAMIARIEAAWGARMDAGAVSYDIADAEAVQHLYRMWLGPAEKILAAVKEMEKRGRTIANGRALRDAVGFCYHPLVDIGKINENFDRLERGEGVILEPE